MILELELPVALPKEHRQSAKVVLQVWGKAILRGAVAQVPSKFLVLGRDRGDNVIGAAELREGDLNGCASRLGRLEKYELVQMGQNHIDLR